MKTVLLIGRFSTEDFSEHMRATLDVMGYNVITFTPGKIPVYGNNRVLHRLNQIRRVIYNTTDNIPSMRDRHMKDLWDIASNLKVDYVITSHDFLQPLEVKKLKDLTGAKIAMWFPDPIVNFNKAYFMNACYDALFFKDPFIVERLADVLQSPVYYMPECFNPICHRFDGGEIDKKYSCDITTAGNAHSWRVAFYRHLQEYDFKVWGFYPPLWMPKDEILEKFQCQLVHNQEKAKAFLGAKIVLNNLYYGEIDGLNVRTFEAAGIGAFQMVDYRKGLEHLFVDGHEIVSFNNISDMHQKIKYYLNEPNLRFDIAAAGKERAYREHTYEHRLKLILATLDGDAKGYEILLKN